MQSDLLGAAALGLKNLLIITGDPPKMGDYPDATAVFDVDAIGLTNVELKCLSILDVTPEFGTFDYVVCHGVYSWVPAPVREKILDICRRNTTPQGVAYVSYNTYPGWHMRGMIRDMMLYHASHFAEPLTKVGQSRALLDFLAETEQPDQARR